MAAVFSAFGISFSDIGKSYEVGVDEPTAHAVAAARDDLLARAGRDMFQEGYELAECETAWTLALEDADGELVETHPYRPGEPVDSAVDAAVDTEGLRVVLSLEVHKALPHAQLTADRTATPGQAAASTTRAVRTSPDATTDCPVYVLADQAAGAFADGPAVVEGPFFTARVPAGWHLEVTPNGDLLFTDLY
jgi:N-methylhydantoinase A/oxoprolinase/acetone carboxylase beta subunit